MQTKIGICSRLRPAAICLTISYWFVVRLAVPTEMIKCRWPLIWLEFSEIEKRIPLHNCIAALVDEGIALMAAVGVAQKTTTTAAAQDDEVADGNVKTHCRHRSESFCVTYACNVGKYSRHPGGNESDKKSNRFDRTETAAP